MILKAVVSTSDLKILKARVILMEKVTQMVWKIMLKKSLETKIEKGVKTRREFYSTDSMILMARIFWLDQCLIYTPNVMP